jgi:predicted transcriptional regulator
MAKSNQITREEGSEAIEFVRSSVIAATWMVAANLDITTRRALQIMKVLEAHGVVVRSTNGSSNNYCWKLSPMKESA